MKNKDISYVIVTGATSGIGHALTRYLSSREVHVLALGRRIEYIPQEDYILPYYVDFNKKEDIDSFCNHLKSSGKHVISLVHCAGIAPISRIGSIMFNTIEETFRINTFSFLYLVNQLYSKELLLNQSSIVALSSIVAERPNYSQCIYGSSKAALNYIVSNLAKVLFKDEIRVNALELGCIKTSMYEELNQSDVKLKEFTMGAIDMNIVINEIVRLISDDTRFTTGSIIKIDSGYSLNK